MSTLRVRIERAWSTLSGWSRQGWVRWLLMAVVSLSILAGIGVVLYANRQLLMDFEWRIRWAPLVVSFPIYSLALAFAVLAWGLIVNKVGSRVGWTSHVRIYCVTNLARRVPGILWYVVGRLATYEQLGVSKSAVTVSSGLELALIVLSGLIVSLMTSPMLVTNYLGSPWLLPIGFLAGLAAMHPAVIRFVLRKLGAATDVTGRLRYTDILLWLAVYVAVWVLGGLCLYALIAGVYPVSLSLLPAVIGAWALSGAVSTLGMFLPVGSALHEVALGALLALFFPLGVAIVATVLMRVLLTLYEVLWALAATRLPTTAAGTPAIERVPE